MQRSGKIDPLPRWVSCRPGFFLPVKVLSRVFRGKYLEGLRKLFEQGRLNLPGRWADLTDPSASARWLTPLYRREWVVYAKSPFGGPEQVLKYLARYTHRVAISNSRLLDVGDGRVTFGYKDYSDDHRSKTMTLSAEEFLRHFMQHVLPKGFIKIRHYGLLANRCRDERLDLCRRLLLVETVRNALLETPNPDEEPAVPICCPKCGGRRIVCRELPRIEEGGQGVPMGFVDSS